MKKRDPRLILIPLALVAVLAWAGSRWLWKPAFRYAGTIEATRIDLPARVATVVSEINVEEGEAVKKGQKLATLACEEVRIAGRLATENFERGRKLRATGSLSQEAFDQLSSRKQESDARLSWCEVASPVDGTVLNRFMDPGEWVNPGAKLLSVADLRDVWTYIYVPQAVMSRLKTGVTVVGRIPELERDFRGIIRKINDEAEFTPKNVQTQAERTRLVFGVKVAFENTDDALKPGMTIEVTLPE
ncbi:MAG: efflux RND transporter periplasmic adaptor subunit [Bacteriovoracia bacterium]